MPYLVLDPSVAQAAPTVTFGGPDLAASHPIGKSLKSLRDRLILELGNRTDLQPSTLNEWINDAYQDLYLSLSLSESKVSFSLTLAPDQPFYMLPAIIESVREISARDPTDNTIGAALEKWDEFTYRKAPDESGEPIAWFRDNKMLVIWPTPDEAYPLSIDAITKPKPLVGDDDFPVLDDKWHEALFKLAKYRAWEGIQNDTKALTTMNEAMRLVQRKTDHDAGDDNDFYPALRPIFSHDDLKKLRHRKTRLEPGF